MKTYLVPIDFSEAADNAAHLAAKLSHQTNVERIVLMNAYYISAYEQMLPNSDMVMLREQEIEESAADRINQLQKLKAELQKQVRDEVEITTRLNRTHLIRAVVDTVEQDKVDLVILGSIGNSTVRDNGVGIGSHVTGISKVSAAPVLVVPPVYAYKTVERIVMAADMKKIKQNIPEEALHRILGKQKIELLVVNIDAAAKHANADAGQLAEETALHTIIKQYNPQYHFINTTDIIKGVLSFAQEQSADLIIALPHKYSFLQSLIHSSVSRQLAACTTVPVLLLK